MTELQAELLKAIEEIAMSKGMKVNDCIKQAIEAVKEELESEYGRND